MKCDVVIPIGPGHEELVHRAVNSVEIAEAFNKGPFEAVDVVGIDDTQGQHGRSKARNEAVQKSNADWIFFLDADDLMHPRAFQNFVPKDYDAVWGKIVEYSQGVLVERYQIPEIRDMQTLLRADPYLTLQMGHFVKREVAVGHAFDVELNTGEDWDYYLRVWKDHKCVKVDFPFMCNVRGQHSQGPKSANGVQWREKVEEIMGQYR